MCHACRTLRWFQLGIEYSTINRCKVHSNPCALKALVGLLVDHEVGWPNRLILVHHDFIVVEVVASFAEHRVVALGGLGQCIIVRLEFAASPDYNFVEEHRLGLAKAVGVSCIVVCLGCSGGYVDALAESTPLGVGSPASDVEGCADDAAQAAFRVEAAFGLSVVAKLADARRAMPPALLIARGHQLAAVGIRFLAGEITCALDAIAVLGVSVKYPLVTANLVDMLDLRRLRVVLPFLLELAFHTCVSFVRAGNLDQLRCVGVGVLLASGAAEQPPGLHRCSLALKAYVLRGRSLLLSDCLVTSAAPSGEVSARVLPHGSVAVRKLTFGDRLSDWKSGRAHATRTRYARVALRPAPSSATSTATEVESNIPWTTLALLAEALRAILGIRLGVVRAVAGYAFLVRGKCSGECSGLTNRRSYSWHVGRCCSRQRKSG